MPLSRSRQVFPDITPYYHCISRCVRRAWLCGFDSKTGFNFDHRKKWIEKRLLFLSQVFAIDLAAYAVMSNHYHVVLRLRPAANVNWNTREVIERWGQLCRLPQNAEAYLADHQLDHIQHADLDQLVTTWRLRLHDLSWFMRFVNEPLARLANREDDCTGRFWEGRFKSQALLGETSLLACMVYVDLNPIRAGIVRRPEDAPHTSIRRRLCHRGAGLLGFSDSVPTGKTIGQEVVLSISRGAYFELINWSSRITLAKHDAKSAHAPSIIAELGGRRVWLSQVICRKKRGTFVGPASSLRRICDAVGRAWIWGSGRSPAPVPI